MKLYVYDFIYDIKSKKTTLKFKEFEPRFRYDYFHGNYRLFFGEGINTSAVNLSDIGCVFGYEYGFEKHIYKSHNFVKLNDRQISEYIKKIVYNQKKISEYIKKTLF